MVWNDAKIIPDEKALLVCATYERIYKGFYVDGNYWSAEGRMMKINPRKWIYEKDLIIDSFLT